MPDLFSTWEINNRVNLYLIGAIDEAYYGDQAASGGRTVGEQLAHIHNVRLMWLKAAQPELAERAVKLEKAGISSAALMQAFHESGALIGQLLQSGEAIGKIKGFKPHPTAFLGYLIAHEAHHRGQVILSLKQSGHPVDKKILFGIWEWGVR